MRWLTRSANLIRSKLIFTPLFFLYGLLLGSLIAIPLVPEPTIAVLNITGGLWQFSVEGTLDAINRARVNSRIRAVVLTIDSPGGEVSPIEQIYLDLLKLRQEKPVVAAIGAIAASGGYYVATAANYIYAEKTSLVGSIGVWVGLPDQEKLDEDTLTSGLFKATGGSRRKILGWLETLRKQFAGVVMVERGSRLKMSEEELSRAEIYLGMESLNYGLIDGIGTRADALKKAAELARIRNYGVVSINGKEEPFIWFTGSYAPETLAPESRTVPVYYYLYFEQE